MQRRRAPSDGDDGERQPRGSAGAVRLLSAGPAAKLPPIQPLQTFPVGPVRRHGLPSDGNPPAAGLPHHHGGARSRHVQQRESNRIVAGFQYRIGQNVLLGIATVLR